MNNIEPLPACISTFPQIQSHQLGLMGYQGNGIIIWRHSAIIAFSHLNWIFGIETQFVIWNCCFIRFPLTPLWLTEWTRGNIENKTSFFSVCVYFQMKAERALVGSDLVNEILFETILCTRWNILIDNKLFLWTRGSIIEPIKSQADH